MSPEVTALFERLRSVDHEYLGTSSALEIHAMIVMDAVNDAVVNLDDPDYVIDTLLATGKSHRRFKNNDDLSVAIFWVRGLRFSSAGGANCTTGQKLSVRLCVNHGTNHDYYT